MYQRLVFIYKNIDADTKKQLIRYTIVSFLSPVFSLFGISAILPLLNSALAGTAGKREILYASGMAVFMIASGVFDLLSNKVLNRYLYYGTHRLSLKVYELQMKEDLLVHNGKDAMQTLAMVRTDTLKSMDMLRSAIGVLINSFTMMIFFAALVVIDGFIGMLICLVMVTQIVVIYCRNAKRMEHYGEKMRMADIQTNGQVTTVYGAYKELRVEENPVSFTQRYEKLSEESAGLRCEYNYKNTFIGVIMKNGVYTAMYIALALVILLRIDMTAYLPQIVAGVMLLIRLLPLGNRIVTGINTIKSGRKSCDVLKEVLVQYDQMKKQEKERASLREKEITFRKGLRIENLNFAYPNGKVIFKDASMDIPAGKSVAIVGASGTGKTTLLDIILGLLPPQSGKIFYDDFDIIGSCDKDGLCRGNLGRIVSYIPQTVFLNGSTIKKNVGFFDKEEDIEEHHVIECLKHAVIWQDVQEMPEGINTLIGPMGIAISGGQRQRIALARALYKEFDLLIMDEATAALDSETERAVIDSIRKVKNDKTLLMVTHHESLARECDYLYRIENQSIMRVR